jgi:hypothetical protein
MCKKEYTGFWNRFKPEVKILSGLRGKLDEN